MRLELGISLRQAAICHSTGQAIEPRVDELANTTGLATRTGLTLGLELIGFAKQPAESATRMPIGRDGLSIPQRARAACLTLRGKTLSPFVREARFVLVLVSQINTSIYI